MNFMINFSKLYFTEPGKTRFLNIDHLKCTLYLDETIHAQTESKLNALQNSVYYYMCMYLYIYLPYTY